MKRAVLFFLFFIGAFFIVQSALSQNPLVKQWDKRFGGKRSDDFSCMEQTPDKGFILCGWTYSSNSGNISTPLIGGFDFWVIKINAIGNKKWDKRFGGTGDDRLWAMCQTFDGGYVFSGYSSSDSSGNKTQDTWGSYDYWIVKTDSLGNKQWDRDYGGLNYEGVASIEQTNDGGYILVGASTSGISGDVTEPNRGIVDYTADFWIVKIDSSGNKMWDKRFGGTENDGASSVLQTSDGGYIIGGGSASGISGDKTQANWDTTNATGDMWIVKIDSAGNKLWDKRFGGMNSDWLTSMIKTNDGRYVLAGGSESGIGGDKTQSNWDTTLITIDYWIIKTDSLFNKLWDKRYGGYNNDWPVSLTQTDDGGLLLSGTSYSGISGDKSENNLGSAQGWIIKTDALGNKLWDKTILTTGSDHLGSTAIQSEDKCYLITTTTYAGIGGYKTQPNWDTIPPINQLDYWIVKFCDSTATTGISNYQTPNSNFQIFPNPVSELLVISDKGTGKKEIEIYDLSGRTVLHSIFSTQHSTISIDVSKLSPGIYFLKAGNEVRKFVKE
jgi:hypothetical protein